MPDVFGLPLSGSIVRLANVLERLLGSVEWPEACLTG